jgi:hypothetical protein
MRLLLALLCMLMMLFGGGCALVAISVGALPLAVIPAVIVVLNLLVIRAIKGEQQPSAAAFGILAILDLCIGGTMLYWLVTAPRVVRVAAAGPAEGVAFGSMALAGGLLLKGLLTLVVGWRLGSRDPEPSAASDRGTNAGS